MGTQNFPEQNVQTKTTLANFKAKEIDFTHRFGDNFKKFLEALGITRQMPVAQGSVIKIYKNATATLADGNVAEGDLIPLSHVTPQVAETKEVALKKYRKATTGEAIQKFGYGNAINITDEALIKEVNKNIRKDLFTSIQAGQAKENLKKGSFQGALATAWGALQVVFEDDAVDTVVFANPEDVAKLIADKQLTLENTFGLKYYTDVTGTIVFTSTQVAKGSIYATAPENLVVAYVDPRTSDVAKAFDLTSDAIGFVGMTHFTHHETLTLQTLLVSGVLIFPERLDGVVKVEIGVAGA